MTPRLCSVVLLLPAFLAGTPAYAQAQTPTQSPAQTQPAPTGRETRPIFGGGAGRVAQSLSLGLSIGHGLFRTERRQADETADLRNDSQFTFGAGNLAYSVSGVRAGLSLSAASSGQYYSELSDEILHGFAGAAGVWLRFSPRTRLDVSHDATYQPAFQDDFQALLDPTLVPRDLLTDVAASEESWFSQETRFSLAHQLSRRSALTLDYGRRVADVRSSDVSQERQDAGFRFTHQMAAGLGVRLGYRFTTGDVSGLDRDDQDRPALHTIDAGLDFNRTFSASRRTTIGIGTGSSIVKTRGGETRFFVTGTGTLTHQMGRTWAAALSASRNVQFLDGLQDPALTDQATGSLSGNLSRRVQAQVFATAWRGEVIAGAENDQAFVTYTTGTGLSVALSRFVSWTVSYARQVSDYNDVEFIVARQLRSFDVASTGVAMAPWRYLSLNVTYSHATVGRGRTSEPSPRFRRHSVVFSVGTSLPLYARVRK